MRAHLKYLRYVVMHKLLVIRAGLAIAKLYDNLGESRLRWWWRLLVHDLSKFSRAEWSPYVAQFYGAPSRFGDHEPGAKLEAQQRGRAFSAAWLHHIHANDHHWQHHVLLEDSGKTIVLIPRAACVYEMVADWIAAGPKVHHRHSLAEAVAETIVWYAENHRRMQMREIVRGTAEGVLLALAQVHGVANIAQEMDAVRRTRESITVVGM